MLTKNLCDRGFVKTPFTEKFDQENMMKMFGWRIPLGRMANPEEIGRVVVFLLSDVSGYVNGSVSFLFIYDNWFKVDNYPQVVNVDGGYS
jgi:NAD(P)-dependent dehydrogenase (short-subunit alcohol dehydrogenase family)